MTELHKWEIEGRDVFIDRLGVNGIETMTREEAQSRLNEYEILKAATERLIAGIKDAHFLSGTNECLRKSVGKNCLLCEAYALVLFGDILENKATATEIRDAIGVTDEDVEIVRRIHANILDGKDV